MKELFKNLGKLFTKKNVLTIPNLMTLIRIILIPIFIVLYIKEQYIAALIVIAVSWLSDIADGFVARNFDQVSELGKMFDPLADKLTQLAMIFCLAYRYPLMWLMFGLFIVRDLTQIVLGSMVIAVKDEVNSANWFGKLSTGSVYIVTIILIVWFNIPLWLANTFIALSIGFIFLSMIAYAVFDIKILKGQKKK